MAAAFFFCMLQKQELCTIIKRTKWLQDLISFKCCYHIPDKKTPGEPGVHIAHEKEKSVGRCS